MALVALLSVLGMVNGGCAAHSTKNVQDEAQNERASFLNADYGNIFGELKPGMFKECETRGDIVRCQSGAQFQIGGSNPLVVVGTSHNFFVHEQLMVSHFIGKYADDKAMLAALTTRYGKPTDHEDAELKVTVYDWTDGTLLLRYISYQGLVGIELVNQKLMDQYRQEQ